MKIRKLLTFMSVLMLLASTTFAQDNVSLTPDGEGGFYVCMPSSGTSTLTLSEADANISTFKLYDDGGASGNYSYKCFGTLTIIAPEGFTIGLSGSVTLKNPQDPSGGLVIIYDGTDRDANILTQTTKDIGSSIISSENSMTVFFKGGISYKGLDLTVTLNAPTPHNVTIADNITHGTIVSDKNQAVYNESVALTITPEEGYIINYVKVTNEKNRSIYVTGGRWYNSSTTAQFNMPSQNVTVTPVFIATNNMTASNGLEFDISQAQNGRITLPENVASVLMPRQQPLTVVLIGSGAKLAFNGRASGTDGTLANLLIFDGEIEKDEYKLFRWIISPQDIAVESTSNVLYFRGTVEQKKFITGTLTQIYSINLNPNGGYNTAYSKKEYTCETETFTLYNPYKDGYEFLGWSGTGLDVITKAITITQGSYGNRSYVANWAKLLTNADITISDIPTQTYTGSAITPTVTVKDGNTMLTLGTDYTITLPDGGCINATDYTVTITGKGNYSGKVEKTFTINPKVTTLGALTITEYGDRTTAEIQGDFTTSSEGKSLDISTPIPVNKVTFKRSFTAGIPATIMLPFNFTADDNIGFFYTLASVAPDKNGEWIATMSNPVTYVTANTPYIFKAAKNLTELSFEDENGITLQSTSTIEINTNGDWTLHGVYQKTKLDGDGEFNYGFAGQDVTADGISVGDFIRAGEGVWADPMRCYLTYKKGELTKAATVLPDRIRVVFPDEENSNNETTDIIENTETEDVVTPVSEFTPETGVKVWSFNGTVYIEAQPDMDYTIVDLTGRTIKKGVTHSTHEEINLNTKGIVIVKIGNKSFKLK